MVMVSLQIKLAGACALEELLDDPSFFLQQPFPPIPMKDRSELQGILGASPSIVPKPVSSSVGGKSNDMGNKGGLRAVLRDKATVEGNGFDQVRRSLNISLVRENMVFTKGDSSICGTSWEIPTAVVVEVGNLVVGGLSGQVLEQVSEGVDGQVSGKTQVDNNSIDRFTVDGKKMEVDRGLVGVPIMCADEKLAAAIIQGEHEAGEF
ncbi:hypothetical protein Q3G72_026501 [Acer saccharum]|nr:hypothetical protein Q3G72_026501 [Acer saccharum]